MTAPTRMTARSVVLSVLLGAHPACASAAQLVSLTADFDIKETALRVALTRMVSAGDLVRSADGYRLSDRLLARQRRQDDAVRPRLRAWDDSWTTLIITAVGADPRSRATLRKQLQDSRFGELREGVWLRPDNLEAALPDACVKGWAQVVDACVFTSNGLRMPFSAKGRAGSGVYLPAAVWEGEQLVEAAVGEVRGVSAVRRWVRELSVRAFGVDETGVREGVHVPEAAAGEGLCGTARSVVGVVLGAAAMSTIQSGGSDRWAPSVWSG